MRAFVWEADDKGNPKCGRGIVTGEYKSIANMRRFFLNQLPPNRYVAEVFYNWDNRYGTADEILNFQTNSCTSQVIT